MVETMDYEKFRNEIKKNAALKPSQILAITKLNLKPIRKNIAFNYEVFCYFLAAKSNKKKKIREAKKDASSFQFSRHLDSSNPRAFPNIIPKKTRDKNLGLGNFTSYFVLFSSGLFL
jgi:hypothetical protein